MKYIFIVTWVVVNVVITSPPAATDEYGIKNNMTLSLGIRTTITSEKSKTFDTKKEAELFIKNAPKKSEYLDSYCKDFKIDSIGVIEIDSYPSNLHLENHPTRKELEERERIYLNKMDSLIRIVK